MPEIKDIGGFHSASPKSIIQAVCVDDLLKVVSTCIKEKTTMSVFGQKHTMGGHCLNNGYMIDLTYLNKILDIHIDGDDSAKCWVKVQSGIIWSDLMVYLNQFSKSPSVLQSYTSFSVGGSVSVNAHGITSDKTVSTSILEIEFVTYDPKKKEPIFILLSAESNPKLFKLVKGGYGLFGIIYSIKLKIVDNHELEVVPYHLTSENFADTYRKVLEDPSVDVKLGRINLTSIIGLTPSDQITLYTYVRRGPPIKSKLGLSAHTMSKTSQFIYSTSAHSTWFQTARTITESIIGHPLDWKANRTQRNLLLHESAVPLTMFYAPHSPNMGLLRTHILQEFFIPIEAVKEWFRVLKHIKQLMCEYKCDEDNPDAKVKLLNLTIRYVEKNTDVFLSYNKENYVAFVFYFRANKTHDASEILEKIHQYLVAEVLKLNGTFYLPYLHHYNKDQLIHAYPIVKEFFVSKLNYDPLEIFTNQWYDTYKTVNDLESTEDDNITYENELSLTIANVNSPVRSHYSNIMNSPLNRVRFNIFLQRIFNIADPKDLFDKVSELAISCESESNPDFAIYKYIGEHMTDSHRGIRGKIDVMRSTLRNLFEQKKEVGEHLNDMLSTVCPNRVFENVCITGEPGKFLSNMKINGKIWVLNDTSSLTNIIERGTIRSPGTFVSYDEFNRNPAHFKENSLDVITCMIGLHHFSLTDSHPKNNVALKSYLEFVRRSLKKDGLFIIREHDGTDDIKSLLHCAHNVFNAVTGVNEVAEKSEIREFRPLAEWNQMMTEYDLEVIPYYTMQLQDPTRDYMIIYRKKHNYCTGTWKMKHNQRAW